MSVKKEESGRRSVQVEVEVPGTPEEVWQAIATGPGVSSWFVPTEILEDGTVVAQFGPGMESRATRTAWEPPHRFAAESATERTSKHDRIITEPDHAPAACQRSMAGWTSRGMEAVAMAATADAMPATTNVADSDVVITMPAMAEPTGKPARLRLMEIDITRPS